MYWNADVFVSPATLDVGNDENAEPGTIDGFPSSTAVDAMATGICLVTSNPRGEHRVVRPGEHYIEVPDRDPDALADRTSRAPQPIQNAGAAWRLAACDGSAR